MVFRRFLVLLLVGLLDTAYAQDFYVVAPNTLRLNSDETIAVTIDGPNAAMVNVLIQDYPGKARNISQILLQVNPGQPEVFKVHLNPADFPPNFLNAPGSPKLVSLDVQSDTFEKEIIIPVSTQSGYVFIQTDKPIYTPKQMVHIRIIPLNEDSLHSNDVFKLQIKNPNGNIVEEKIRRSSKSFVTHTYKFPVYPILGEWSATVLYGYEFQQNSTVRFDLEEYVLPTFTVELKTPEVILPSTEAIKVSVLSQYAYGKKVQGIVTFRLGIKRDNSEATFFAIVGPKELRDGASELQFKTDDLKAHKDTGWFPEIDGSRLVVEATVVDHATGNHEVAEDSKGRFTISPFIISFKRCLTDFKPGYASVFEAEIYYVSGTLAVGIPTKIKALADNEQLNIVGSTATTDENGKVAFEVQTEPHHNTVSVTIETDDPKYIGSQAKGNFVQRKFESPSEAYIALDRSFGQRLQVNDTFRKLVHFVPEGNRNIYYLVVARGKIISMNKITRYHTVEFQIIHEMVPSFRVLLFTHFRNELLADSLKFEVERECNRKAQVSITPDYKIKEPGSTGEFIIRGTKGTFVGLLAVDEAVYALSKKDLLTNSKVFNKFDTHDLGCGPGGGMNVNTVLGNAGITIGTNIYSPSLAHACVEIKRRKREAALDIVNTFTGVDRMCCSLGIEKDRHHRNCEERNNIVVRELKGQYENCSRVFLECCTYAVENGLIDLKLERTILPKSIGDTDDELDFLDLDDEVDIERDLTVRSDFRETWIFDDIQIGVDGIRQYSASLPHSITTWVIQAVSFSSTHGICVAEPQKLVSFKKVFLHLNLPYSVVRNEQVEIQATVFNYGYKRITAIMYMYGTKDLCTGSQPGEKSEKQKVVVDAQSAASAFFPVIPLKAENYPIKVLAFSAEGSDVIIKTLHVVHEGVPKEISIPIKLDPTNRQNRTKRHVYDQYHTDTIHPDQNLQVTTIKLNAPEGFVPGTASCSIAALGDRYGTVIETAINNPDALFQKPRGCGEQNMVRLAPTLYTVRYLKVTGKLTPAMAEKGYDFIRIGYDNQLKYRKRDGSYAAFLHRPSSLWLTAFVTKVFCQATEYVYIDNNVLCSGVKWLIDNQESDGSFIERNPMLDLKLMGGVEGKTPMTAFTLIALQECKCDEENLHLAKMRAVAYLEVHLPEVNTPLAAAIVAYALALSNSELNQAANDRLLSMMETDKDLNTMYWTTDNDAQDIQTAGYGLLTQLIFNDLTRSNAIVNWLNTKQQQSGCYKSTQDTVIALQALSEYSIRAQMPTINLVTNITSSNDRDFHRVLTFHKDNALLLQDVKVDKIGGTLFINTGGEGVGSLAVKLRYNLLVPPEEICKFDVTVNVSDAKIQKKEAPNPRDILEAARRRNISQRFPDATIRDVAIALDDNIQELETVPKQRRKRTSRVSTPARAKDVGRQEGNRQNPTQENSKPGLKLSLCVRYLGNADAGMSIVDVGIFSGFEPLLEDLKALQGDPNHLIERYEKSGRGVVFYLQKIPTEQDYCFSFHVVREYIVGNTQTSVIKVYDYYNPDATCTKFYSPSSHSPILRTICEGGICECAEGGCPPRSPFSSFSEVSDQEDRRQMLLDEACEAYDYVWKGQLNAGARREGGFLNISFVVENVIKEGIEKRDRLEGEIRTLLARDNCHNSCPLFLDQTYLILGRDGQKYKNNNGNTWYRYILDKNSAVHMWTSVRQSTNRELQRDLNFVTDKLIEEGCKL